MKINKRILILSICCMVLLFLGYKAVFGQIMGSELEKGKFEIGYTYKLFYRDLDDGRTAEWSNPAIFGRYAINGRWTISGEGFIGMEYPDRSPEKDYRCVGTGAGMVVRIWEITPFQISISGHYYEVMWHDRSPIRHHKSVRSIIGAFRIQRRYTDLEHEATVWIAPSYINDTTLENTPWGSGKAVKTTFSNKLGFVLGGDLLMWKHVATFLHVVYIDYLQPRLGIGYQF